MRSCGIFLGILSAASALYLYIYMFNELLTSMMLDMGRGSNNTATRLQTINNNFKKIIDLKGSLGVMPSMIVRKYIKKNTTDDGNVDNNNNNSNNNNKKT